MPTPIEHTLYEFFAGRATPLQQKLIEEWLREPGHEEAYFTYLARWEADHLQYTPDTQAALTAYQSFMSGRQPYPRHRPALTEAPRRLFWQHPFFRSLSVAAALALVLGAAYATRTYWLYERLTAPYGQTRTLALADGSEVTLNAHSSVRVPRWLAYADRREVWLDGEAYFSVNRTPDRRSFIVHTANLDVQVLGTRFNVNTRRGQTQVVLNEGKVQLMARAATGAARARPIVMQPGETAALAPGDTAFRKTVVPTAPATAWRDRRLVFDETPLSQVAQTIEDYYGIKVVIGNRSLARRELTGTLPNNDLSVVLKTLSVSYNLAVVREPNRIILR